ncbi:hypothetical protein GBAR_LOCUS10485, partial [Geodia barretti]
SAAGSAGSTLPIADECSAYLIHGWRLRCKYKVAIRLILFLAHWLSKLVIRMC